MEWIPVLLLVLGLPVLVIIWLSMRVASAREAIERLTHRVGTLEEQVARLQMRPIPPAEAPAQEPIPAPTATIVPPSNAQVLEGDQEATPPPIPFLQDFPQAPFPPAATPPASASPPRIDWEQFMGVKLFAWVGGLALFLGVCFLIKYSFDNNLISPSVRMALGFLAGAGLLVGGMLLSRREYPALSQTLCATGTVILYSVTFACRSYYHFALFTAVPTFLLMALITAVAILLAVRLEALVIAVLGMLGGFLTPVLLSTGEDNPYALFGYIAILDLGLIAVALRCRWWFVVGMSAVGTVAMEVGWAAKFFEAGSYFEGSKIGIPLGVLLVFCVLYLLAAWWSKRERSEPWIWDTALGMGWVALAFAGWFLSFRPVGLHPWMPFGFIFCVDLLLTQLGVVEPAATNSRPLTALAVFVLLSYWTMTTLNDQLLLAGLGLYFVYAMLHSVLPLLLRKPPAQPVQRGLTSVEDFRQHLPTLAMPLTFLLLVMATQRLRLTDPSPLFGLGLLLVLSMLGLAVLDSMEWLPAIALVCVAAMEASWQSSWNYVRSDAVVPLEWYTMFLAVFLLFPFVFRRLLRDKKAPWAAAAMAAPLQFLLIYRVVVNTYHTEYPGLLPAAFAALMLAGAGAILKLVHSTGEARLTQLAWFGGVALFFVTVIFPIQFEHEWVTIGWALEGVALLWLFYRLPHQGLYWTGVGLLIAAFVRLALNPVVLEYHPRTATPIFNWYLYAYGLTILCLFCGAWLSVPLQHKIAAKSPAPVLASAGTILAFLLVNIEIADFFSAPGSTLTFQFGDNFARDMTYSIAWALFALVLLVIGIAWQERAARYAAMGLLSVTLLKLFLHDLARLAQLYRIGAFIGVAIIAMLASFAYQRFFHAREGHQPQP